MGSGGEDIHGEVRYGSFGGGKWPVKVNNHSEDYAVPYRVMEIKSEEETPLDAREHVQIGHDQKVPPEEFYEDLDILLISNHLSNHEIQFYHAVENMPDDGAIFYEKALSPRYWSHRRMQENGVAESATFNPSGHYPWKAAALEAEDMMFDPESVENEDLSFDGLGGVENVEVVCMEDELDPERAWILTRQEGGMPLDYGVHAGELLVVTMNGRFAEDPLISAKGFDMGADINETFARYPEAFAAQLDIEGERFKSDATMNVLMGKEFTEEQKHFRIHGEDPDAGEWRMTGFYGTEDQERGLILTTEEDFVFRDLSDSPSAKKQLVDEYIDIWNGKTPKYNPEDHAEIMRGLVEPVNGEIGIVKGDPETDEFDADIPSHDPTELHSVEPDEFYEEIARKVA